MATVRELVSRIKDVVRLHSSDADINDRVIAHELQSVNIKFALQRLNNRIGQESANLYTPISCIPMTQSNITSCIGWATPCKISRSVNKIPTLVESKFGSAIQGIWTIDKKHRFKETSINRYANILELKLKRIEKFFWILDGYLYVNLPDIDAVAGAFFFQDFIDPESLGDDSCGCNSGKCPKNPLDLQFRTVNGLEEDIVKETTKKLLESYLKITPDKQEDDKPN